MKIVGAIVGFIVLGRLAEAVLPGDKVDVAGVPASTNTGVHFAAALVGAVVGYRLGGKL